jgi:hypothetical protein
LVAQESGAEFAVDLRAPATSGSRRVRLLFEQPEGALRLAVSVDGSAATDVLLDGAAGPAALELVATAPLSVVRVRLVEGVLRFHGIELEPGSRQLHLDVFGYPGATAAGWRSVDTQALRAWFGDVRYDVVALAYGTNEANAEAFDDQAYRRLLTDAVLNLRRVFPMASCVLLAPGDRGVLVRRAGRTRLGSQDLLRHSRVHESVGRIQAEVAAQAGCHFWSALDAMGGPGSAYAWARESPPLMAPDLLHFTVLGYQRLGQSFGNALGWRAPAAVR